jgi:hypothetical protein
MNSVTIVNALSRNRSMTEGAPKFAEALEDQPGMPDAGNRTETQHHLLVDVEDRDQQRQRPQQSRAIVLAGLRVGAEGAGVIVADHYDEPRPENREQRLQLGNPAGPWGNVTLPDRAERAVDVTDMGSVEDGALLQRCSEFSDGGHCFLPHSPHWGADAWRPDHFGSFSAIPSLSARLRISAHTSSGGDAALVPQHD